MNNAIQDHLEQNTLVHYMELLGTSRASMDYSKHIVSFLAQLNMDVNKGCQCCGRLAWTSVPVPNSHFSLTSQHYSYVNTRESIHYCTVEQGEYLQYKLISLQ